MSPVRPELVVFHHVSFLINICKTSPTSTSASQSLTILLFNPPLRFPGVCVIDISRAGENALIHYRVSIVISVSQDDFG